MADSVRIGLVLPDVMGTYGDGGNAVVLRQRLRLRGIAAEIIAAGEHQLVICDELTYLCTWGWVETDEVVSAIVNRPEHVNIVITGRDAAPGIIDVADTVTEMTEIKHAYTKGIPPKRGIDY